MRNSTDIHSMIRFGLSILTLVAFPIIVFCQNTYSGKIVDKFTKKPIPFATIGLIKQNIGLSADENGSFRITINDNIDDSLRVSSVGYQTITVAMSFFRNVNMLALEERHISLKEIIINTKVGNYVTLNNFTRCSFDYYHAGLKSINQLAQLYEAPEFNMLLTEITLCKDESNSLFRIHIYEVDSISGSPSNEITDTSIEIHSSLRNIVIDFKKINIIIPGKKFFIAVEWLLIPLNEYKVKTKLNGKIFYYNSYNPGIGYKKRKSTIEAQKRNKNLWVLNYNGKWTEIIPIHRNFNFSISPKLK